MGANSHIGEVDVVGFDESLLEQAAALRVDVFGDTREANRSYLRWKYLENPYLDPPLVHFALTGESVVGFRGSVGTCWEVAGRRHVLPQGADLMVDERLRRHGIARRLQTAYLEMLPSRGHDLTVSLSAGTMGVAAARASGWEVVAAFEAVRFSRRRSAVLGGIVRRGKALARRLTGADAFAALDRKVPEAGRVLEPETLNALGAIAARAAPSDRLRHVRDPEYFAWRLGNPLVRYRVLTADDAYLVLQWSGRGAQVNLVDWSASTHRALAELVGVAARRLADLRVWEASLDDAMRKALSDAGSVSALPGPSASFVVRYARGDPREERVAGLDPFALSSWDVRMLDSDEY